MKQIPTAILLISALLSCQQEKRYTTDSGLQYMLYASGSTDSVARMGNIVKIRFLQKVGDSIIDQNYDRMPLYYTVMPYGNRYNPLEVLHYGLRKGDSVVTIQRVDSMLKKGIFPKMPPWMKGPDLWYTYFKVIEVFRGSDSLLVKDKLTESERVIQLQSAKARQIILGLGRNLEKKGDAFVETLQPGTGPTPDSLTLIQAIVGVRTLKDSIITSGDSVRFQPRRGYFPAAVDQAVRGIRKGEILEVLVPAVLVTGAEPPPGKVAVDDVVVFWIRRWQ